MPSVADEFLVSGGEVNLPSKCFGKVFLDYVKNRDGSKEALVDVSSGTIVTYKDILVNCVRFAISLRNEGIEKGNVIMIVSENNFQYYLPVISSVLLNAVVYPINVSYNTREIEHALKIAKPKIAFVSESALSNFMAASKNAGYEDVKIVTFGNTANGMTNVQQLLENGDVDTDSFEIEDADPAETAAFVLLSSGTTGYPKGVLLSQQNLFVSTSYLRDPTIGDMGEKTTTLLFLPFFHVFGLYAMVNSIILGAKSILLGRFKPETFLSSIEKYSVDKLYAVPATLLFMAKSSTVERYDLSSVNDILCGAAPLSEELRRIVEIRLQCSVRQVYGMTELSGAVACMPKGASREGSVGRLIPGTTLKIWDYENGKNLRCNEMGELCFKTKGVMMGYVNNPDGTKSIMDEDGFLHSGDVGYFDEDGYCYIVDRIKELIKYKGFQVAPAELESILISHESVKEVGVVGIPDEKAGELPLAFVVKEPNKEVTEQELVDFVAEHVSVQKRLYGGVKFLEELPKNTTGKVVRRELRRLFNDSIKINARSDFHTSV